MKKLGLIIALGILSAFTCACGNTAEEGTVESLLSDKYVTLGDYKNLEVTLDYSEPTEEQIQSEIESDLNSLSEEKEVSGRAVKEGDIVNIDYVGTKDGVAFDGGTASGYDLTIGSGQFIPGFESGLIGANIGDDVSLNLTFPENYTEELAGADVVFDVKINSIKEKVVPELTDEIVASIGDGYSSVADYKEAVKEELYQSAKTTAEDVAKSNLMTKAVENATVKDVPQWLVDNMAVNVKSSAESYAAMFGVSMEDFVEQALGETMEQFELECDEKGKENAKEILVVYAIAAKENLVLPEEELNQKFEEYKASYGMTEEQLVSSGQKIYLQTYLQKNEIINYLYENANITE